MLLFYLSKSKNALEDGQTVGSRGLFFGEGTEQNGKWSGKPPIQWHHGHYR